MCRQLTCTVAEGGRLTAMPHDCGSKAAACRRFSAPMLPLGEVVADVGILEGRSHVVSIAVKVRDAQALDRAAREVGLVAVATEEFEWWGRWLDDYAGPDAAYRSGISPEEYGRCAFALVQEDTPLGRAELEARAAGRRLAPAEVEAIRVAAHGPNWRRDTGKPYAIGVKPAPDGDGFLLVWDNMDGRLAARIGKDGARLKQAYAAEAAVSAARAAGYTLRERCLDEEGRVRLVFEVPVARSPLAPSVKVG